ncbi:hypothetical protein [Actinoallomurus sp. CA-142502]|uniref:hypothetical protein n=1 Tax=Actinoallomurus sp. CA-142502 TaxID=3239885 RepID=UPI003D8FF008
MTRSRHGTLVVTPAETLLRPPATVPDGLPEIFAPPPPAAGLQAGIHATPRMTPITAERAAVRLR